MKKVILTLSAFLLILIVKAQNISNQATWQQMQGYSTMADKNTLAPFYMFQQMGNNSFQRKTTRYRIKGASAGELGSLTDTLKVKFSGNRESKGLVNNYYYIYQLGTPYESDPYDEITTYTKVSSNYKVDKRYTKKYDANGRIIEAIDSLFGQKNRNTYTYNANNKIELALNEVNYGSGWQNYGKTEFSYTANTMVRKGYSWSSGAWKLNTTETTYGDVAYPDSVIDAQTKKTYTYDASHNLLTYGEYKYSSQTSTYEPVKRENWMYTGGKLTDIEGESWMQGAWEKTGKNKITYTSGGEIDSVKGLVWKNSVYENYSLTVHTYQGTKLKDFTNYNWNSGNWNALNKFAFVLNAQLNLDQVHFYINQGGILKFVRRYRYYYESFNSTLGIDNIAASSGINVYPNPASTALTFDVQNPSNQAQTLKIYDLAGKMLFEKPISPNELTINLQVSDFTNDNGVYIYSISSNQNTFTGKFIINQ